MLSRRQAIVTMVSKRCLVSCGFAILVMSSLAWAGVTGDKFVVRPWLTTSVFVADRQTQTANVTLFYQVENLSGMPAVIGGVIEWEVKSVDVENTYTASGKMSFVGQYTFDHSSSVADIVDGVVDKPKPAVQINVPPGRYSYTITLKNGGTILLASKTVFEVRL